MIWEERKQYAECDGCDEVPYPAGNDFSGTLLELVDSLKAEGWVITEDMTWDGCLEWTAFCPECVATGAVKAFYLRALSK